MNINLIFETILILFAILASNGIIYSFTFINLNDKNSSENISVITNSSEKDGLALTTLIASNSISFTSSESSASQTLSVTSSETNVSQDIFDSTEISEGTHTENSYLTSTNEVNLPFNVDEFGNATPIDSVTVLNTQSLEQWREMAMAFQELPINTPDGILQIIKFEELKIFYSKDMIEFCITPTELRLIIEHFPAVELFNSDINHLILIIMSYYHG